MRNDFTWEIVEHIGVVSETPSGWALELNVVSWNGGEAKYDIREWSPEHDKMGKGLRLTAEQMQGLKEVLNGQDFDSGATD